MELSKQTIEMLVDLIRNFDPYKAGWRTISRIYSQFLKNNNQLESHHRELFIYRLNLKGLFELIEELANPQNWIENEAYHTDLVKKIGKYLEFDWYQLILKNKKYIVSKIDTLSVDIENKNKINFEKAVEMLSKLEKKLREGDYADINSDCSTILECVLADIYHQITNQELGKWGDLIKDYKTVSNLLWLEPNKDIEDGMKSLTSWVIKIISWINTLSNWAWDRHRTRYKPDRLQSKLMLNITKTIVDFLYDKLNSLPK